MRSPIQAMFQQLDADKSGDLSEQEFQEIGRLCPCLSSLESFSRAGAGHLLGVLCLRAPAVCGRIVLKIADTCRDPKRIWLQMLPNEVPTE